jgi:hypothetical protein
MPPSSDYQVFISHGSADAFVAGAIRDKLVAAGVSTFLDDTDISVGSNFRDAILENIQACSELAVLLTPTSINRAWVFAEVGIATDRARPVVGIVYGVSMEELTARGAISLIGDTRVVDLNNVDEYVTAVAERASKHVGG